MVGKIISYVLRGMAWGCTISSLICTAGVAFNGEGWIVEIPHGFAVQTVVSMLVGIAWVLPCLLYQNEKLSRVLQVLLHFVIGFAVYLPSAFYMGWISSDIGPERIAAYVFFAAVVSLAVWAGFYYYYRNLAKQMNEQIQKITK